MEGSQLQSSQFARRMTGVITFHAIRMYDGFIIDNRNSIGCDTGMPSWRDRPLPHETPFQVVTL